MISKLTKFLYNVRSYLIFFIGAFILTYFQIINFDRISNYLSKKEFLYEPSPVKKYTNEINLIYVGSSNCIFSKGNELIYAIDHIKFKLDSIAASNEIGFSSIGVAMDRNAQIGIKHLKEFGYFNEFISGNFWSNTGSIYYLEKFDQELSTPQIILTKKIYSESLKNNIIEEEHLLTITGKDRIVNWSNNEIKLPEEVLK